MAVVSLLLYGCATHSVDLGTDAARGHIAAKPGRVGIVVAAPHGTSDPFTGDVAAEVARRTGFGLVVATGFAIDAETREGPGRRYQVNRPMEGVPGRPATDEVVTDDARRVYESYEGRVREAAQGPLAFYVEVHGNNRHESADRIEVATVGVDAEQARRLRTLFELVRDAHLRAQPGGPRLAVLVEPADRVLYSASGAKREGILRLPARALHIELPRAARAEWRDLYTAVLADFLAQAVALQPPR